MADLCVALGMRVSGSRLALKHIVRYYIPSQSGGCTPLWRCGSCANTSDEVATLTLQPSAGEQITMDTWRASSNIAKPVARALDTEQAMRKRQIPGGRCDPHPPPVGAAHLGQATPSSH